MTDGDRLPIVFRPGPKGAIIVMAVGAAFVALGIVAILEHSSQLIGIAGSFRTRAPVWLFGWLALIAGGVIGAFGWRTLKSGRPSLELNAEGVVVTPRFGSARRFAWADIASIEIERFERTSSVGDASIETIMLVMRDERREGFVPPGDAQEIKAAMERVRAAR